MHFHFFISVYNFEFSGGDYAMLMLSQMDRRNFLVFSLAELLPFDILDILDSFNARKFVASHNIGVI